MSRLPTRILRVGDFKLRMVEAAVLLGCATCCETMSIDFLIQKHRYLMAQRLLAAWLTPCLYFARHAFRPRFDDFAALVKELAILGLCDFYGVPTAAGTAAARQLRESMPAALTPQQWAIERQKYAPRKVYAP